MKKIYILVSINLLILILCLFLYFLNMIFTPTIMAVADAEARARSIQLINKVILDEYSKEFNYDDIIKVDKDENGNIVLIKADTLKMNQIACNVSIISQEKLKNLGDEGFSIPFGYIFKNNFLYFLGPDLKVKMQLVGNIQTKYISDFESAGINQTKFKIYVSFKTNMRIILPVKTNHIEVINEVPIAETIIVGKIPDTSIQLDLDNAGYKLNNTAK